VNLASVYEFFLLALCLWREARGRPDDEKRAIAHVIVNRATDPGKRFGPTMAAVITAPSQFSSMSPPHIPNLSLNEWINATTWPVPGSKEWVTCCAIADAFGNATEGSDPTGGATNYYSEPIAKVPDWADPGRMTLHLGVFRFYRL